MRSGNFLMQPNLRDNVFALHLVKRLLRCYNANRKDEKRGKFGYESRRRRGATEPRQHITPQAAWLEAASSSSSTLTLHIIHFLNDSLRSGAFSVIPREPARTQPLNTRLHPHATSISEWRRAGWGRTRTSPSGGPEDVQSHLFWSLLRISNSVI
ncbi:hypothetical protein E2C01_017019 [Portunus trituberculatus]|uniref:Uncharacterized protein n=1 Tax=Portunus trituberculatus TaxID=210409 RepID=A0A5B7DQP6_PORTR|nr:hypothetical protein [Portunus trituberculatus]